MQEVNLSSEKKNYPVLDYINADILINYFLNNELQKVQNIFQGKRHSQRLYNSQDFWERK